MCKIILYSTYIHVLPAAAVWYNYYKRKITFHLPVGNRRYTHKSVLLRNDNIFPPDENNVIFFNEMIQIPALRAPAGDNYSKYSLYFRGELFFQIIFHY